MKPGQKAKIAGASGPTDQPMQTGAKLGSRSGSALCVTGSSRGELGFGDGAWRLGARTIRAFVNVVTASRVTQARVELLLFDDAAAAQPARVINLDRRTHRTYHRSSLSAAAWMQ